MGVPAPNFDCRCFALRSFLLNTVLGGGMSSRLFQKIREERGMAYSILQRAEFSFRDTGRAVRLCGNSAGECAQVIRPDDGGIQADEAGTGPEEELQRAKDQLKGNILLGLESSSSRMSNLARQEMYFDHFPSARSEIIENIERVTVSGRPAIGGEVFLPTEKIAVTLLGNLPGLKVTRDHLEC